LTPHGITPDVDPENMAGFCEGGKKFLFKQKGGKKKKLIKKTKFSLKIIILN
jgi:hypothetical protein